MFKCSLWSELYGKKDRRLSAELLPALSINARLPSGCMHMGKRDTKPNGPGWHIYLDVWLNMYTGRLVYMKPPKASMHTPERGACKSYVYRNIWASKGWYWKQILNQNKAVYSSCFSMGALGASDAFLPAAECHICIPCEATNGFIDCKEQSA